MTPEPTTTALQDLIEALTILDKYGNEAQSPTHYEHDVLAVFGTDPSKVSEDDIERLKTLGFIAGDYWETGEKHFYSFRFGSA